jgi:hypothetical protein
MLVCADYPQSLRHYTAASEFTDHTTKAPLTGDQVGGRCANYRGGDLAEAVVGSAIFLFIDVDCEVHVASSTLGVHVNKPQRGIGVFYPLPALENSLSPLHGFVALDVLNREWWNVSERRL